MRKRTELVVRIFCIVALIILIIYAVITKKNGNDNIGVEENVGATITPTPTVIPTNTPVPTATPTPEPTVTPVPTPTEVPKEETESMATKQPTLYTTYSDEELELLFRVVEAEATGANVECKSHVASVIFNRLKEGWWDGDLTKNIMAKRQFEVITNGRYKTVTVTEDTIIACEIAFKEDTAQGALFFDSTNGKSWAANNLTWIFRDKAMHDFYRY